MDWTSGARACCKMRASGDSSMESVAIGDGDVGAIDAGGVDSLTACCRSVLRRDDEPASVISIANSFPEETAMNGHEVRLTRLREWSDRPVIRQVFLRCVRMLRAACR